MDIKVRMSLHEVDGADVPVGGTELILKSHWNRAHLAVLSRSDRKKESITVHVNDPIEAVRRETR